MMAHAEVGHLLAWARWVADPWRHQGEFPYLAHWLSPHLGLGLGDKTTWAVLEESGRTGKPVVEMLMAKGRAKEGRTGGAHLLQLLYEAQDYRDAGPAGFLRWSIEALAYRRWLAKEGKEDRYVEELLAVAGRAQSEGVTLNDFLEDLALEEAFGKGTDDHGRVTLSTAHRAKGLEWGHVFVLGFDEGIWPSAKARSRAEVDEERRLWYVAATRAREALTVAYTSSQGSPFLFSPFEERAA